MNLLSHLLLFASLFVKPTQLYVKIQLIILTVVTLPLHYVTIMLIWGALEVDQDNYLSLGECFEVEKTKEDGIDFKPREEGYRPQIFLSIIDSLIVDFF